MKKSAADKTNRSEDRSPSKPRYGVLTSPRAEAFKKGKKNEEDGARENPFDLRRYREIYSETD